MDQSNLAKARDLINQAVALLEGEPDKSPNCNAVLTTLYRAADDLGDDIARVRQQALPGAQPSTL